jgi:hypothetical protein
MGRVASGHDVEALGVVEHVCFSMRLGVEGFLPDPLGF